MNNYSCYFTDDLNKKTIASRACWYYINQIIKNKNEVIYIAKFNRNKKIFSEERLEILIKLINNITPCKIIEHKEKRYIEFKLLRGYDNNLFLLNFIRNLWYTPHNYDTNEFFNYLIENNKKRISSLKKLMQANINACKDVIYGRHHSNALNKEHHNKMIVRGKKDLYNWRGYNLTDFMIGK